MSDYIGAGETEFRPSKKAVPGDSYLMDPEGDKKPNKRHELDSYEYATLHGRLMGHYYRELDRQRDAREQMADDEDFYDHIQWSIEEIQTLEARGQLPLVYNVTHTAVNWVLGSQRKAPTDYKILPRKKAGGEAAERKSQLLKYLSDINHTPMHVSRAFAEVVKVGLSWLETGAQNPEDGEDVYERYESWRNIIWDSTATEWDLSDARYIIRTKWVDADRARAMFPERKGTINEAIETVFAYGGHDISTGDDPMDSVEIEHNTTAYEGASSQHTERSRVRLFEIWYQQPVEEQYIRGGEFSGEVFDPWSVGHQYAIRGGQATIVKRTKERMFVAIATDKGLLYHGKSPYRHNRYPFTPIWGYRRARDNMPYGLIRGVRDIQKDVNKRASKMLYLLTHKRVFVEEGAVEDIELLRDEANRADGVIEYKAGKRPPEVDTDHNLAAAHADLMSRGVDMIQQTSGVTDENMGRTTNATSGKAILARQSQGQMTTSVFFENLHFARRIHGEKNLMNVEQFFTDEKEFRITNERGKPEYITINQSEEDMITAFKADFVVDEMDYNATAREANVDRLLEAFAKVGGGDPQMLMAVLDLIVESMDLPKRDEIVKRIRQVTGAEDPDADPDNPDPETIQREQAKDAHAKMMQRVQTAELMEKEAKAAKTMAEARKTQGSLVNSEIEATDKAIQAAATLLQNAGAGEVADMLMRFAIERAEQSPPMGQPQPNAPPPPQPQAPPVPMQ